MTPHRPEGDAVPGAPSTDLGIPAPPSNETQDLFARTDWSATPLGPVELWPANLRSIVDICLSSGFPMLVCWGPQLAMVYNDGYRTLLGQSKHPTAWGRPVADVWPEVWDVIGPMFEGVLRGGPATWVEDELLVVDRHGFLEEAYFTWSYGAIHDSDDNVAGILNVATETTDKVLAVRRAKVAAELFEALAGGTPPETPEQVRDRTLEVLRAHTADHLTADLDWVDAATATPRATPEEATSGENAHARAELHVLPVLEPGRSRPTASLRLRANPRRPWDAQLQVYAELCASHVAVALSGVRRLRDERHRAEVSADLDVAKSDFFANVSHELRTPLTLIAGPVHDALASDALDAEQRQRFELIARNTDRLTGLVDRILDLTRVEAGAVEPHWVRADLVELTSGIAANFRPAIERLGLEFDVQCDELGHEAYVDVDMFERIVLNLLSNALKFTPYGRISLHLAKDGDGFAVSVTDTGIGIAEADLERVFDRFRQLDRRDERRSREGAGIGLSFVKHLVEIQGGSVSVTSAEGEGSTFEVRLPWGSPSDRLALRPSITPRTVESFVSEMSTWTVPDVATAPAPGTPGGPPPDTPRPTLLVVEDNQDMRDYIARHVAVDYDVTAVRDGVEALAWMRVHPPSIVLADVMMPRMDGLTLVREIRSDAQLRDVPVVLLSARAGVEASTIGLTEGADDYVVKPFEPAELRARLAANLVRARARSRDAAWLRAILGAIREPLVVADSEGTVVEMNDAFTTAFGWAPSDGPLSPPYPWWVPTEEDPEEHEAHARRMEQLQAGQPVEERYRIRRRGGGEAWVHVRAASVPETPEHAGFVLGVARDETREREAQMRRELAGRVALELAAAEDLDQALATAVTGFTVLFDGEVTLRVSADKGEVVLLSPQGRVRPADLDDAVRRGLGSAPHGRDLIVGDQHEGLLLLPTAPESDCRAWVQFHEPRLVGSDELIVGDLLAQSFGQAVDRVVASRERSHKEHQLEQAIESHRLIGHAVGVLIERHRITAKEAFEMLRQASLNRNIKLREIAARVVESGQDPDTA